MLLPGEHRGCYLNALQNSELKQMEIWRGNDKLIVIIVIMILLLFCAKHRSKHCRCISLFN